MAYMSSSVALTAVTGVVRQPSASTAGTWDSARGHTEATGSIAPGTGEATCAGLPRHRCLSLDPELVQGAGRLAAYRST
ncbi:hypothetical protein [Nonomuraea fuscirosea]|uniref:hypothetical protein n=1 Tax=Nonomuraea fuscirosea TaxID=1291556 RepID=UPI0033C361C3